MGDEVNKLWNYNDYKTVYAQFPIIGAIDTATLLGRSVNSTISKAVRMNISTPTEFSPMELSMAENYGKTIGKSLIFLLPNRTTTEIEELLRCTIRK